MVLPKFDNNGALITYNLKEVAIQGYVFEISKDTIVNNYVGGRPLEIIVTKNWENMENVKYPKIKRILHQIMFAKTMDESGTDLKKDEHGEYILTPVEYSTYEKVLKKGDEGCTADTGWTYTFGKLNDDGTRVNPKENIRQIAPDGSVFAYYITEELANEDNESVALNSENDNGSINFLGDFYKASEIRSAIDASSTEIPNMEVKAEGLGFKVKELIQPGEITGDCTDLNINEKITGTASITNSYEPSIDNFKGKLIISKTWNNHDSENENGLNNNDFKEVRDYTFKIS